MAIDNNDIDTPSRLSESSNDYRNCSLAKNGCHYTPGNEYCEGHGDTIADGDCRGRDPEDGDQHNPSIGTNKDVEMRETSMAKNAALYTPDNEYCRGHEDTIADGDDKGRDPEDGNQHNQNIGTSIDIHMRNCLMARNGDMYTRGNEYCSGHADTIADGDCRGRDPEDDDQQNPSIGTVCDVEMRTRLQAKNTPSVSDDGWSGYTPGSQYCAGSDRV